MSIKKRLTVNIDVKDAIFGGAAIYASVFLITAALVSVTDYALRFFSVIDASGEVIARSGLNMESMYPIFMSVMLAVFLVTFFVVVLFDENLFSKHETGLSDLLGLGVIWAAAFIVIDSLVETLLLYISMFQGWGGYYPLSIRGLLFGLPYWAMIIYIIFLPAAIYYLRLNHKNHMEKIK